MWNAVEWTRAFGKASAARDGESLRSLRCEVWSSTVETVCAGGYEVGAAVWMYGQLCFTALQALQCFLNCRFQIRRGDITHDPETAQVGMTCNWALWKAPRQDMQCGMLQAVVTPNARNQRSIHSEVDFTTYNSLLIEARSTNEGAYAGIDACCLNVSTLMRRRITREPARNSICSTKAAR